MDIPLQTKCNKRNIDAIVQAMESQAKEIVELRMQVTILAQSVQTLSNDLSTTRISMSNATAAMGNGPTVRS